MIVPAGMQAAEEAAGRIVGAVPRTPGGALADLTGMGVQDTAIATLPRRLAADKGLGIVIES